MILLAAARERLGEGRLLFDRRVAEIAEAPGGRARARFADRDGTDPRVARGRSADRRRRHPLRGACAAGAGRGAAEVERRDPVARGDRGLGPFLSGRSMIMAGHQNQKFVCYPISRAAHARGRARLNWIAEIRVDPAAPWRREDWNRPGRLEEFLPAFESWRFDWLDVPALIRGAAGSFEYPMVDRDPLRRWSFGPITLLGDAAHPMYPIGSNGASQAILDAAALARAIAANGETPAALHAYEAERRPATSAIVLANRGNGPEQVMQLAEQRAPDGFARHRRRDPPRRTRGDRAALQAPRRLRPRDPQRHARLTRHPGARAGRCSVSRGRPRTDRAMRVR